MADQGRPPTALPIAAGLCGAWLVSFLTPHLPLPPLLGTIAASWLLAGFSFLVLWGMARLQLKAYAEVAIFLLAAAAWWLVANVPAEGLAMLACAAAANCLLVIACAALGCLLSHLIREAGLLVPAMLVAAMADAAQLEGMMLRVDRRGARGRPSS